MKDEGTASYFDRNLIFYENWRLDPAIRFINEHPADDAILVDVGCGIGNTLKYVSERTGIRRLCGIDVSPQCLLKTKETVDCETYLGSILDDEFIKSISRRFDFALLGAVLHHLVGGTRRASKRLALQALRNSLKMLKVGGYLIILEPTFSPSFIMGLVFWVKTVLSRVTTKRIELLAELNNIGAPIVSFYTIDQLFTMIAEVGNCEIVETSMEKRIITRLMRLALITKSDETTVITRKLNH